MNKPVDLSFTIITNTSCVLRCKHCYQTKEEFESKEHVTKETMLAILDRIEEFCINSPKGRRYGYEIIGGETFLLPFEFWEWLLPVLEERLIKIENITGVESTMCIYTNLMYKDERYTDFIKKHNTPDRVMFSTSWEAGTNRFGSKNQLLGKWKDRFKRSGMDAVHVVLTKEIITMGAKAVYDFLVGEVGIDCVAFETYVPTDNSRAETLERPNFSEESAFLKDFYKLNISSPNPIELSPHDEMRESLENGYCILIDGGEKYYVSVLPNGEFRNMTLASQGDLCGDNNDKHRNEKFIWTATETLVEEVLVNHEKCQSCEYLRYCHGGYTLSNKLLDKDINAENLLGDCHGHKEVWDLVVQTENVTPERSQAMVVQESLQKSPALWGGKRKTHVDISTSTLDALSSDTYIESLMKKPSIETIVIDDDYFISLPRKILFFEDLKTTCIMVDEKLLLNSGYSMEIAEGYIRANFSKLYIPANIIKQIFNQNRGNYFVEKTIEISNIIYSAKHYPNSVNNDYESNKSIIGGKFGEFTEIVYWLLRDDNYKEIFSNKVTVTPLQMQEIMALSLL